MNKRVSDIDRIIRELKESTKRIVKTMSEYFAQLAMLDEERRPFTDQPKVNPKGALLFLTLMV